VNIRRVDVDKTLNSFLRSVLHLTGTKRMCLEGGCGACIVAVERKSNVLKKATVQAVNSVIRTQLFAKFYLKNIFLVFGTTYAMQRLEN
jgi:xanthine dehydrogenase iron-sulfur cluster and FAD-binding subunit A